MAVVAAGSRVKDVTRDNIFPYWWTRSHWREQIPQLPLETQKVTMNSIKATNEPNHNLRYCPDWTASEVAGRPKKLILLRMRSENNQRSLQDYRLGLYKETGKWLSRSVICQWFLRAHEFRGSVRKLTQVPIDKLKTQAG